MIFQLRALPPSTAKKKQQMTRPIETDFASKGRVDGSLEVAPEGAARGSLLEVSRNEVLRRPLLEVAFEEVLLRPFNRSTDVAPCIGFTDGVSADSLKAEASVRLSPVPAFVPQEPVFAFEGCVDGLDPRWNVVGWARLRAAADARISVALYVGRSAIAFDVAKRFRGDLFDAKVGDGKYGFQLAIPADLFDGLRHRLEVRVRADVDEAPLGELDIILPTHATRRTEGRDGIHAAKLVEEVLGVAFEISLEQRATFAMDLTNELALVAQNYDFATAISLLYIHVLKRRVDEGGLQTRLTRLSTYPEQLLDVVREVVFSDEASEVLRQVTGTQIFSLDPLRAWTRARRFA